MKKVVLVLVVMFTLVMWTNNANAQCTGLIIQQNPTLVNQVTTPNQTHYKIGSYRLLNNTSGDIHVTTISTAILQNISMVLLNYLSNITIECDGMVLDIVNNPSLNNYSTVNFYVFDGATKIVDVYANISPYATGTIQTALGYSGLGDNNTISPLCPPNTNQAATSGQTITIAGYTTPIIANFTVDTNQVCRNVAVNMTNHSTYDTNLFYEWYIPEGNQFQTWTSYNLPMGGISFYSAGIKTIIFRIKNSFNGPSIVEYSKEITVWPNPNSIQTLPQNPILGCGNTPVTITASALNGNIFTWKNGTGAILGTGNTFSALIAGNYYLECKNIYGCGINYDYSFNVQAHNIMNPKITLGGNNMPSTGPIVGLNNTITDTLKTCANSSGEYTLWSNGNYYWQTTTIWDDSSVLNERIIYQSGKYFVKLIDQYGCVETDSAYVKIYPKPIATISGNLNFCTNAGTTLSLNNAYAYSWNNGASTQSTNIYWGGEIRGYTISIDGCISEPAIAQTQASPTPDNSISYSNNVAWILFPDTNNSYQWYYSNNPITGDTNAFCQAINSGLYEVEITNNFGCTSTSQTVWLNSSLGVESSGQISEKIYPNPFQNNFNIEFSDNENHIVKLYDVAGREIYQSTGKEYLKIEKENLESGIYFLQIDTRKELAKIIKE